MPLCRSCVGTKAGTMLRSVNGACAEAAAAAALRWSRLQLSFAHLGLNLRPLLTERLLVPTGRFYFTFFCLLWIIFKTLALASISRVFRPSFQGPALFLQAWKSASAAEVEWTWYYSKLCYQIHIYWIKSFGWELFICRKHFVELV